MVDRAADGLQCLELLQSKPAGYYAAVLMDIQMPNMDGYAAARAIRAMPDDRAGLPIIAMTANAFEEDKQRAFEAGMNDHIAKPISVDTLLATLREKYEVTSGLPSPGGFFAACAPQSAIKKCYKKAHAGA